MGSPSPAKIHSLSMRSRTMEKATDRLACSYYPFTTRSPFLSSTKPLPSGSWLHVALLSYAAYNQDPDGRSPVFERKGDRLLIGLEGLVNWFWS